MGIRSLLNMLNRLEGGSAPRKRKKTKKQRRIEERKKATDQEHQA
jgi:hypothetical protein